MVGIRICLRLRIWLECQLTGSFRGNELMGRACWFAIGEIIKELGANVSSIPITFQANEKDDVVYG